MKVEKLFQDIKLDADSKNIEHITVEKDEKKYRMILSNEKYEELAKVIPLARYDGLIQRYKGWYCSSR